ncbi:hypothetical protein Tco_0377274, partial [Tanacetum coccineum]
MVKLKGKKKVGDDDEDFVVEEQHNEEDDNKNFKSKFKSLRARTTVLPLYDATQSLSAERKSKIREMGFASMLDFPFQKIRDKLPYFDATDREIFEMCQGKFGLVGVIEENKETENESEVEKRKLKELIYETIEAKFESVLKEKRELEDMLKENMEMYELFYEDEKFELFVKKFKEEFTTGLNRDENQAGTCGARHGKDNDDVDSAGHSNDEDGVGHVNHGDVHANGNDEVDVAEENEANEMGVDAEKSKKEAAEEKEANEASKMRQAAEKEAAEKEAAAKEKEAKKIAATKKNEQAEKLATTKKEKAENLAAAKKKEQAKKSKKEAVEKSAKEAAEITAKEGKEKGEKEAAEKSAKEAKEKGKKDAAAEKKEQAEMQAAAEAKLKDKMQRDAEEKKQSPSKKKEKNKFKPTAEKGVDVSEATTAPKSFESPKVQQKMFGKGQESTEKPKGKRITKPLVYLKSPFMNKMVKKQDKVDEDEILCARSVFCMQGDITEVVFDDEKGEIAHRKEMQSLAPGIEIEKQINDTLVTVLNYEERIRTDGKDLRRHYFSTDAM